MTNQNFTEYLQQIQSIKIPQWEELPQFDLYMDQVVSFINQMLKPLDFDELTPAMINNYVKSGLIKAPQKKKYRQAQVARLILIAILKSVFSINEIAQGIQVVTKPEQGPQNYDYFVSTFIATIHDVVDDFQQEVVIKHATQQDVVVETNNLVKLSCSAVVQRVVVLKLLAKLQEQVTPATTDK